MPPQQSWGISFVSLEEKMIQEYIRSQEEEEKRWEQMRLAGV